MGMWCMSSKSIWTLMLMMKLAAGTKGYAARPAEGPQGWRRVQITWFAPAKCAGRCAYSVVRLLLVWPLEAATSEPAMLAQPWVEEGQTRALGDHFLSRAWSLPLPAGPRMLLRALCSDVMLFAHMPHQDNKKLSCFSLLSALHLPCSSSVPLPQIKCTVPCFSSSVH